MRYSAITCSAIAEYLTKIPNATVDRAAQLLTGGGESIHTFEIMRRVVQLELLTYVAPMFTMWTPEFYADPTQTRKAVGTEAGLQGYVEVHIDPDLTPRQLAVLDGVEAAGFRVKIMFEVPGHPVEWSVEQAPEGLVITDSTLIFPPEDELNGDTSTSPAVAQRFNDTHLNRGGNAILKYHTGTEADDKGELRTGKAVVRASFPRYEWFKVLKRLYGTWLADLAPNIAAATEAAIGADVDLAALLQAGTDDVARMLAVAEGSFELPVTYHETPETFSLVRYPLNRDATNAAPSLVAYTCHGLNSVWKGIVFALTPGLEQPVSIDFSGGDDAAFHLAYDYEASGLSPAIHLEYEVSLHLDKTASPPTVLVSAIQNETAEGVLHSFETKSWGEPSVATPLSTVPLVEQFAGFSHPFLTQSATDCPAA